MPNHRHIETVKQGVAVWNRWRSTDKDVKPSLGEANLMNANLPGANLRLADLRRADLRNANLNQADLCKADLRNANLRGANLVQADLSGANLSGAIVTSADLSKATLSGADLRRLNAMGADLFECDLCEVNLSEANLQKAHLLSACLKKANMRSANLSEAVLVIADLTGADLCMAELTGARLYGAMRDDWKIDGVRCGYAFWDAAAKKRTPGDRDYAPGEFEQLYRHLPTIEFPLEGEFMPMNAILMDQIVKSINQRNPDLELSLDSLIFRGAPRAVFSVLHKQQCHKALTCIEETYQLHMAAMEETKTKWTACYRQMNELIQ